MFCLPFPFHALTRHFALHDQKVLEFMCFVVCVVWFHCPQKREVWAKVLGKREGLTEKGDGGVPPLSSPSGQEDSETISGAFPLTLTATRSKAGLSPEPISFAFS